MFITVNIKKVLLVAIIVLIILAIAAIIVFMYSQSEKTARTAVLDDNVPVLIIDAGHGGEDGGAVGPGGERESAVNLEIAMRLEALAALCGVETVMTRTSEELNYPQTARSTHDRKSWDQKTRAELINSVQNATLISIHQNKYPGASPRGPQVLYSKAEGSKELGELAHANLCALLYPESRRVAVPIPDNIYLIRMAKCPAILVECGFLSNPGEFSLLTSENYQLKLAGVILASYMQYIEAA